MQAKIDEDGDQIEVLNSKRLKFTYLKRRTRG